MRLRYVLLLCTLAAPAWAQRPLDIALPTAPIAVREAGFSIVDVRDVRADTASVGRADTGLFNTPRTLRLKGGTMGAVGGLLRRSFPPDSGRVPLVVEIEALQAWEHRTLTREVARAEARLTFARADDPAGPSYTAEAAVETGGGADVTSHHPANLHRVLEDALQQVAHTEWPADTAGLVFVEQPRAAVPAADTAAAPGEVFARLTADRPPVRTLFAVMPIVGAYAKGAALSYFQFLDRPGRLMVPVGGTLGIMAAENPKRGLEGLFFLSGASFGVLQPLGASGLATHLDLQLNVGQERIDYGGREDTNFFFGGRFSPRVVWRPAGRGVVVGVGAYGSALLGSDLYPTDAGLLGVFGAEF